MSEKYISESDIKDIKERLESIEKIVKKIETLERAEIEYINAVKDMESQELKDLNKIVIMEKNEMEKMNKLTPLKFTDIMAWKNAIWEGCPHKIIIDSKAMVLFNCEIKGKVCSFGNCPRNVISKDEE